MDLNHLRVFLAVAETESFSAAARRLSLPKSTVSRSIAALEQEMNLRLLHRTTRRVSLSTAGRALFERVAPALASLEASICQLPELVEQPSGRLRVTCPIDIGSTVVAEIATRFVSRYPAIELELRVTNERLDLVAEGFDLALRIAPGKLADSSLSARSAGPVMLHLYASPTYLARRGTPRVPADLAEHEWVMFRREASFRLEGGGRSVAVRPHGRLRCDDMFFAREAVRHGAGIGILPAFLAAPDLAQGQLVRVLPRWNVRSGHLWVVTPSARNVPRKVSAFREFVLEALRSRPLDP